MIVGNGMLARAFARLLDDDNILIFASGVSNSLETRPEEFLREKSQLAASLDNFDGSQFAYFGSCGVANDPEVLTPYLHHKLEMEKLVLEAGGTVFRLPQVVGRTPNPNTLTNFLRDRILNGEHFQVWAKAERNLLDVDDAAAIAMEMLRDVGASGRGYTIAAEKSLCSVDIVQIFERVIGKRASYTTVAKGDPLTIEIGDALRVARALGIDLGDGYAERVIRKYYGSAAG